MLKQEGMKQTQFPLALWLTFALSIAVMLWAADVDQRLVLVLAALAFTGLAAAAAYMTASNDVGSAAASSARGMSEISRLTGLVYAWGGVALISLYRFTSLHWQHGWQYGSAMLLIAAGLFGYVAASKRTASSGARPAGLQRIALLAAAHGLAALAALLWLIFSGKLATPKGDWAANAIFMTGGFTIVWFSYLAVRLYGRSAAHS